MLESSASTVFFYEDFETYRMPAERSESSSPSFSVLDLPTDNLGAFSASFTPIADDGSFLEACTLSGLAGSYCTGNRALEDLLPPESTTEPLDSSMSKEVAAFWQRYSEYPNFLKRQKRRTRRKRKRPSGQA